MIACKTPEELLELAKSEGLELGEEELEVINGGMVSGWSIPGCPKFDGHTKAVTVIPSADNSSFLAWRGIGDDVRKPLCRIAKNQIIGQSL